MPQEKDQDVEPDRDIAWHETSTEQLGTPQSLYDREIVFSLTHTRNFQIIIGKLGGRIGQPARNMLQRARHSP